MTKLTALWRKVASSAILERSSQTISAIHDNVYIFGGEYQPRKPRDNDVHVVGLKYDANSQAAVSTITSSLSTSKSPPARVGSASTAVHEKIYIFSGRGGPAMTCIEENGSLWAFDTRSSNWSTLSPADPTLPYPEARSYHAFTSDTRETLFLHAGCPAKGRLSDLWSFHIPTQRWKELSPAPQPARGGTSLAFSDGKLYRMNGFDGTTEQGGSIDTFDIQSNAWTTIPFTPNNITGPQPRSVSCLLPLSINHNPSLLTMFGERDPSSLGHEGAGKMLRDIWVFDIRSKIWSEAQQAPAEHSEGAPVARGWFDADVWRGAGKGEGNQVVLHGGLNEENERLGDVWVLNIT